MAWSDVWRILTGRKTDAEVEAERRFRLAVENHKARNGEVDELADELGRARAVVHARIDALSGGAVDDGREIQGPT